MDRNPVTGRSNHSLICSAFSVPDNGEFCRFHGNKINKNPKPIETLVEEIMKNKQPSRVLHYVCELYVKVRFFNRLKYLNIQIKAKEASERIRKLKQIAQHIC